MFWNAIAIRKGHPFQAISKVVSHTRQFNPDVIGCSGDAIQVIGGFILGRHLCTPTVTDCLVMRLHPALEKG